MPIYTLTVFGKRVKMYFIEPQSPGSLADEQSLLSSKMLAQISAIGASGRSGGRGVGLDTKGRLAHARVSRRGPRVASHGVRRFTPLRPLNGEDR